MREEGKRLVKMQRRRSRWGRRGGTQILFLIVTPVLLGAAAEQALFSVRWRWRNPPPSILSIASPTVASGSIVSGSEVMPFDTGDTRAWVGSHLLEGRQDVSFGEDAHQRAFLQHLVRVDTDRIERYPPGGSGEKTSERSSVRTLDSASCLI